VTWLAKGVRVLLVFREHADRSLLDRCLLEIAFLRQACHHCTQYKPFMIFCAEEPNVCKRCHCIPYFKLLETFG